MNKGVEYILEVIDHAAAPFERLFGNIDKASNAFGGLEKNAETNMSRAGKSVGKVAIEIGGSFENSVKEITEDAKRIEAQMKGAATHSANAFDKLANDSMTDIKRIGATPVVVNARDNTGGVLSRVKSSVAGIKNKVVSVTGLDKVSSVASKIKRSVAGIKDKLVNINARDGVRGVVAKIKNSLTSLKDKTIKVRTRTASGSSGLLSSLSGGGIMRSLGGPLVAGGIGLGALLGGAISKGMENDLQKTNITTLMRGDVEAAGNLFKTLSTYSIKTPYEKTDIIEGQKTMMSFGLSSEFAFSKLKNIGDIALGDANKMKSLSLAFSQATSAGKLQGQDLIRYK